MTAFPNPQDGSSVRSQRREDLDTLDTKKEKGVLFTQEFCGITPQRQGGDLE
jgi:hypothetical protein